MALPADYQTGTVTARYVDTTGDPVTGAIEFTPVAGRLISQATDTIVIGETVSIQLDENGELSVTLPATDDPDISPTGFTYRVVEKFDGGSTYYIDVPYGTTTDLSSVEITDPASGGTVIHEGEKGDDGPQGPAAASTGLLSARPAAAAVADGYRYFATDEFISYVKVGIVGAGSWVAEVPGAETLEVVQPSTAGTIPTMTSATTLYEIERLVSSTHVYDGRPVRIELSGVILSQGATATSQDLRIAARYNKNGGSTWYPCAISFERRIFDINVFGLGYCPVFDPSIGVVPNNDGGAAALAAGDTFQIKCAVTRTLSPGTAISPSLLISSAVGAIPALRLSR